MFTGKNMVLNATIEILLLRIYTIAHSVVFLIFTEIASIMLISIDIELTNILSETICAKAIIKKIVAVAIKASYEIPVRIV